MMQGSSVEVFSLSSSPLKVKLSESELFMKENGRSKRKRLFKNMKKYTVPVQRTTKQGTLYLFNIEHIDRESNDKAMMI